MKCARGAAWSANEPHMTMGFRYITGGTSKLAVIKRLLRQVTISMRKIDLSETPADIEYTIGNE
jgi:hypothetical protein